MSLRIVVAGAGARIWFMHAPAVAAVGATIVGVHDIDRERAMARGAELGCHVASSLDELLAIPADLAVVLTPHRAHADTAIACLAAGLDVLVEKPLAADVNDADRMVAAAAASDRLLAVALQQRTRSEVAEARRLIAGGAVGELQRVDLLASWPRRSTYFASAPWRGTWRYEGGGVLVNQGQHDLDLLCLLAGRPSRIVAGRTRRQVHPTETEDTASALVEWPNRASGSIHLSTAEVDEAQRIEITGTRGRIRLEAGRLTTWQNAEDIRDYAAGEGWAYERPASLPHEPLGGDGGTHADLYRDLADAIAERRPPIASAASAVAGVELANGIIASAHTRKEIDLPLDRAAYAALLEQLSAATGVSDPTANPRT